MLDSPPESVAAVLDARGFADRTGADPQVMEQMERYRLLLLDWASRFNLVGPSAIADFWPRHAFDSAQLHLIAPDARRFVDIGSGAGFPGLVLAILLKPKGGHVHLVESVGKRCGFLRAVVGELGLPASVHQGRAETAPSLDVEIVTARACAPMERLLAYAAPFLLNGRRGLFLKGRNAEIEVAKAARLWRFRAELLPSLSDPDGRIVSIERLSRA